MKKTALIVLGALVLAAAGWTALWFAGRGAIEGAVAAEIDRLRAGGMAVTLGEAEVGGFPAGYRVAYRDVEIADTASGVRYHLPRITGEAGVTDPKRVTFRFPDSFTATVPVSEAVREKYGDMPETATVEVEADDLALTVAGRQSGVADLGLSADSVMLVSATAGSPLAVAIELVDLDASARVPESAGVGTISGRSTVGRLEYAISALDPNGVRTTLEGISDDLSFGGTSSLRTPEQWEALFRGAADGAAELFYEAGQTDAQVKVEGNPQGLDGTVKQTSGAASGVVRIGQGQVELRATAQNNRYEMTPAAAEAPVEGELTVGGFEVVYAAPIAPGEEMRPFTGRLALTNVAADERLWAAVDPEGVLDHEEAHLVVELTGTGRLVPTAAAAAGASIGQPIELGSVQIAAASAAALGAVATAEGAVDFAPPLNVPTGTVTLRMSGVLDALEALKEAGLVGEGTQQMAALLATLYTRAGEPEGELVSDVVFSPEGIAVNGLPISNAPRAEPALPSTLPPEPEAGEAGPDTAGDAPAADGTAGGAAPRPND